MGGKTGPSEKVSKETQKGQKGYIVALIGLAPADKPQLEELVCLDEP